MRLLLLLVFIGVLSGLVGSASLGSDWQILGASSGLVMAVAAWMITNSIRRARYERRINRHFHQKFYPQERADDRQ